MTLYKGTIPIAGLNTNKIVAGRFLFEPIWSDHIINDIQYLRADTFSWQSGDVYVTAYNKLVEEYQLAVIPEETEGGVTFKRSANSFKIADASQEANILAKYNSDGIAWYYILDTENRRFKLPRTKFGFEGLRTNVGYDISESLPNIKGIATIGRNSRSWQVQNTSGSFYNGQNYGGLYENTSSASSDSSLNFDASRSSSTYQDNAPVQERGTQMYLYFYVGEFTQTAIEQTAGLNSELFNNKADINLANVPASKGILEESYINDASWYRIYSDGWCEQGGVSATSYSTVVTLLKPYVDTNYTVTAVGLYRGLNEAIWVSAKTNSTISLYCRYGDSYVSWQSGGYIR